MLFDKLSSVFFFRFSPMRRKKRFILFQHQAYRTPKGLRPLGAKIKGRNLQSLSSIRCRKIYSPARARVVLIVQLQNIHIAQINTVEDIGKTFFKPKSDYYRLWYQMYAQTKKNVRYINQNDDVTFLKHFLAFLIVVCQNKRYVWDTETKLDKKGMFSMKHLKFDLICLTLTYPRVKSKSECHHRILHSKWPIRHVSHTLIQYFHLVVLFDTTLTLAFT